MATDYLVFIHGVNMRSSTEPPTYANELFTLIQNAVTRRSHGKAIPKLVKVPLYWGSVSEAAENELLEEYRASPYWQKFWFRELRERMLLQFTGDIALYLSRYFGGRIADKLMKDAQSVLGSLQSLNPDSPDRLHLIGHSLGTVILFDLLFSARWDQEGVPGHDSVMTIREAIYGVEPAWEKGIQLATITTMGAPLGLFSLINVDNSVVEKRNDKGEIINTHDITPRLQMLLERMTSKLGGRKLPWLNFAHPGDALACPLVPLLPNLVDGDRKYLETEDILLQDTEWTDYLTEPLRKSPAAIWNSGNAHLSYMTSYQVGENVARVILQTTTATSSTTSTQKTTQPPMNPGGASGQG
jgi:hypothetical protein